MKKLFTSMFLVLALLAMTAGTAFAQETTAITGTVQSVVIEENEATGETIVVVTLIDEATGTSQTINISLETAQTLGLVATDPTTGVSTVTEGAVGTTVEIDPITVIPEESTEEDQHPVGSALSDFFGELLGVDYETVIDYHSDGVGFGVIAQALWLSNSLGGGTSTFIALLDAKQSGDYSGITLADGSTPDNWGDVVRQLKKGDNLGSVMSGRATGQDVDQVFTKAQKPEKHDEKGNNGNVNGGNSNNINGNNGNANGNSGNNNGNNGGNGNGNGGGNGNGNGGGNGNGH